MKNAQLNTYRYCSGVVSFSRRNTILPSDQHSKEILSVIWYTKIKCHALGKLKFKINMAFYISSMTNTNDDWNT